MGTRMKLIQSKFERYYDYYLMKNKETVVQVKGSLHKFNFQGENNKKLY